MNVQSNEGQLAKEILCEFMKQFQKRNPNLFYRAGQEADRQSGRATETD